MGFLANNGVALRRMLTGCGMLGLAAVGVAAAPQPAQAWWHGGWCCAVGIALPPVVVAPAPVYVPPPAYYAPAPAYYGAPPAYYAPPQRAWFPGHWAGGYWIPGHWG